MREVFSDLRGSPIRNYGAGPKVANKHPSVAIVMERYNTLPTRELVPKVLTREWFFEGRLGDTTSIMPAGRRAERPLVTRLGQEKFVAANADWQVAWPS